MKKTVMRKYAQLIAKCGVNVQKGQEVIIVAEFDQPEFVRMVAEECYRLGAKKVRVDWTDQKMSKIHTKYQSLKTMSTMEKWEEERWQHNVDVIPCRIYIESEDPDGLKGVDMNKVQKSRQALYPIIKKYRDQLENKYQWCIAAVPGEAWAKKLFPELSRHQAVEKLWEAILMTSRVTDDPIKAWEDHNADLAKRCAYLNRLGIDELHYQAANGTDFTVGLMEKSRFCGGGETSLQNIFFNPNIPSEECFTSPKRGRADGIVYATKPLSYQGQLIENFWIRFKDGKAVEWNAEKNNEMLTKMLTIDEGASYLGECALVPVDSPISNSGLLFYNTLFDENAACHLAVGRGFPDCVEGFETMSLEEVRALGVNESMTHVDFMIGCDTMNITAKCRDGKTVPIFRNGNWAF
ncbi:MAG: aminopeptidase [Spirochaetales bacterium]|nr:aminopeptidase [Spirochaetales bacterium]